MLPAGQWSHLLDPFDVVVLGNPNNPTGSMQSRNELRRLFEMEWSRPKRWIVDEAFMEFAADHDGETLLSVIEQFPSLIVLRSLTKTLANPGTAGRDFLLPPVLWNACAQCSRLGASTRWCSRGRNVFW